MKILGLNITRASGPRLSQPKPLRSPPFAWGDTMQNTSPVMSNAYQQVVWVYRAINVLAEQVANIPFLFSTGERGRENLITSGPLIDFYNRPHPQINRFQYWELRVIWLMLRGECVPRPHLRRRSTLGTRTLRIAYPSVLSSTPPISSTSSRTTSSSAGATPA